MAVMIDDNCDEGSVPGLLTAVGLGTADRRWGIFWVGGWRRVSIHLVPTRTAANTWKSLCASSGLKRPPPLHQTTARKHGNPTVVRKAMTDQEETHHGALTSVYKLLREIPLGSYLVCLIGFLSRLCVNVSVCVCVCLLSNPSCVNVSLPLYCARTVCTVYRCMHMSSLQRQAKRFLRKWSKYVHVTLAMKSVKL